MFTWPCSVSACLCVLRSLRRFPPNVQHLVLNKEVASAPLVQVDGSRLQTQLNVLDRHIFPIPYYDYRVVCVLLGAHMSLTVCVRA